MSLLENRHSDVSSILQAAIEARKDSFSERLLKELENIKAVTQQEIVYEVAPKQYTSRDSLAMHQGIWTPAHVDVLADMASIQSPHRACAQLARLTQRAFSHLERRTAADAKAERVGTNVFIGHGRSKEWKDLKDFIQDRMRLPWDEFNRIAVAGIPTTDRLSEMLNNAAIAFLVFTGEDELADAKKQARDERDPRSRAFSGTAWI